LTCLSDGRKRPLNDDEQSDYDDGEDPAKLNPSYGGSRRVRARTKPRAIGGEEPQVDDAKVSAVEAAALAVCCGVHAVEAEGEILLQPTTSKVAYRDDQGHPAREQEVLHLMGLWPGARQDPARPTSGGPAPGSGPETDMHQRTTDPPSLDFGIFLEMLGDMPVDMHTGAPPPH